MRGRNNSIAVVLLGAGCLFVFLLTKILLSTTSSGSTYPPYSSLRADPLGTKALYDSLSEMGGLIVWRSFKPLIRMNGTSATVVHMSGTNPEQRPRKDLYDWESIASNGARLIVVMRSVGINDPGMPRGVSTLERRLQLQFDKPEEQFPAIMKLSDAVWQCYRTSKLGCIVAERLYGKGTLIMITDPFLLSNEAMRTSRDTALIAKLLGTPSEIIFDEEALGIEETGSITALMRRYGLTGAIGVLLVLGVLFLWRSMSSLLPPRERDETAGLVGRSAVVGLVNLYRRAIPKNQLISTCFAQWSKAKAATFAVHQDRISRMETASKAGGDPVAAYNAIARILREKL